MCQPEYRVRDRRLLLRQCYVLRVFTRGDEGGNHLGVIVDLTALDAPMMQTIAVDLAFSESVFIDASGDVPHCRIFTPTAELAFAGHPLVGAAWLLHHLWSRSPSRITFGDCIELGHRSPQSRWRGQA
jgi:PhzF family phenazine biosynthesis protein